MYFSKLVFIKKAFNRTLDAKVLMLGLVVTTCSTHPHKSII